jgi:hypothetical protein
VNEHGLLLPNAVDAVTGLQLQLRVPVDVDEEQVVPAHQVQTDASGSQAEQHDLSKNQKIIK